MRYLTLFVFKCVYQGRFKATGHLFPLLYDLQGTTDLRRHKLVMQISWNVSFGFNGSWSIYIAQAELEPINNNHVYKRVEITF